ncbi:helix-turn-helix domain-containing protein [Phreatobacter cathodiphilus]|uniref:Transcriptional regulator n=1 Tax=Phreatobacter cathodiphilus TaxID=1868589 RepID=A0A2S0N794_9HYPH|nr:helix-turn-helix transcriptional regulator [Phreatobacter cathodiphilus]AVO44005.1 transcriptional regulator [Phreatobacter cathodiphilus]
MTEWTVLRERMLVNPAVRAEYDALADEFALVEELIKARAHSGLTQEEIARRMGTTQSVVARLESGKSMPSTRTLKKYAEATGTRLVIRFEPAA